MKQNVIQRLAQKYIRKQDKIPSNWKQIKNWIKEFSEYADMVLVVNKFAEEILELLKSEKEMEDWRKIADKEETPFLSLLNKDKAGFNDGWRLAINRIYNSWIKLKEEIKKEL